MISSYIENLRNITKPTKNGDGLGLDRPSFVVIRNCMVDFSNEDLEEIDECLGITRGAEAYVYNCEFKGAQKVVLIGCGDEEYLEIEKDKAVVFDTCTFKYGSRRMPEVQDGMRVLLLNCTIEDWCNPNRYTFNPKKNRGFGAWSHDDGSILAINCMFHQSKFWKGLKLMLCDFLGHMGQTFNDEGILGLFKPKNWIPGVCRGLTSGKDGRVEAYNCTKNHWWIRIENNHKDFSTDELEGVLQEWLHTLPSNHQCKGLSLYNETALY